MGMIYLDDAIEAIASRDETDGTYNVFSGKQVIDILKGLPSAEKAQLSEEDATSVCKCPCEYREPCDYCHYDAYRGHGCPAEEGKKAAEADEHAL